VLLCRLVKLDAEAAGRVLQGAAGMYAIAAYPETVGAVVMQVEGGLHMVAVCTYAGQAPPFKDDQLLDFIQQVRCGCVAMATPAAMQAQPPLSACCVQYLLFVTSQHRHARGDASMMPANTANPGCTCYLHAMLTGCAVWCHNAASAAFLGPLCV
jgi:cytochrome c551/c552